MILLSTKTLSAADEWSRATVPSSPTLATPTTQPETKPKPPKTPPPDPDPVITPFKVPSNPQPEKAPDCDPSKQYPTCQRFELRLRAHP